MGRPRCSLRFFLFLSHSVSVCGSYVHSRRRTADTGFAMRSDPKGFSGLVHHQPPLPEHFRIGEDRQKEFFLEAGRLQAGAARDHKLHPQHPARGHLLPRRQGAQRGGPRAHKRAAAHLPAVAQRLVGRAARRPAAGQAEREHGGDAVARQDAARKDVRPARLSLGLGYLLHIACAVRGARRHASLRALARPRPCHPALPSRPGARVTGGAWQQQRRRRRAGGGAQRGGQRRRRRWPGALPKEANPGRRGLPVPAGRAAAARRAAHRERRRARLIPAPRRLPLSPAERVHTTSHRAAAGEGAGRHEQPARPDAAPSGACRWPRRRGARGGGATPVGGAARRIPGRLHEGAAGAVGAGHFRDASETLLISRPTSDTFLLPALRLRARGTLRDTFQTLSRHSRRPSDAASMSVSPRPRTHTPALAHPPGCQSTTAHARPSPRGAGPPLAPRRRQPAE